MSVSAAVLFNSGVMLHPLISSPDPRIVRAPAAQIFIDLVTCPSIFSSGVSTPGFRAWVRRLLADPRHRSDSTAGHQNARRTASAKAQTQSLLKTGANSTPPIFVSLSPRVNGNESDGG